VQRNLAKVAVLVKLKKIVEVKPIDEVQGLLKIIDGILKRPPPPSHVLRKEGWWMGVEG
jgi:hypothetical protein